MDLIFFQGLKGAVVGGQAWTGKGGVTVGATRDKYFLPEVFLLVSFSFLERNFLIGGKWRGDVIQGPPSPKLWALDPVNSFHL